MGSGIATVTAKHGPGVQATAKVLTGVKAFFVNMEKNMIYFYLQNDDPTGPMREFALADTMTMTTVIAAGLWTITLSA